jgi:hypothetical protein
MTFGFFWAKMGVQAKTKKPARSRYFFIGLVFIVRGYGSLFVKMNISSKSLFLLTLRSDIH